MHPEVIISHRMKLADTARAYERFEKKEEDRRRWPRPIQVSPLLFSRYCSNSHSRPPLATGF